MTTALFEIISTKARDEEYCDALDDEDKVQWCNEDGVAILLEFGRSQCNYELCEKHLRKFLFMESAND